MAFVYERVEGGGWTPPWLRHQNLARYQWAAGWVADKEVAEIGCGAGDGTRRLLAAGARHVDGFDVSVAAIASARRKHAIEGLRFEVASALALPAHDHAYDLVISLEAIEHVVDDAGFVSEARRVLRPGGRFLCSTPNRALTNPGTRSLDRPFNPHHIREYTGDELIALLRTRFDSVELLGQSNFSTRYRRALEVIGRLRPRAAVRLHQARKLLGMPLETLERHRPRLVPRGVEPEVLVAICT
jgi:SAM-dependent methyltransferase